MKIAVIKESDCIACGACAGICGARAVVMMEDFAACVDPSRCLGCGRCIALCPECCISLCAVENKYE